jgi:choline-sulfatase
LKRPNGVDDTTFFAEFCPPLPPNFEPQQGEPEAIRLMIEQRPFRLKAREHWSEKRWREHRWAYARLTEMVDRQISRLLTALDESGQAERTLVIFTSDHGDMDSAHRLEHKSTLYEETCRVPLIVRPPGGTNGRTDSIHVVSNGLDLMPTLCEWAGVSPPPGLGGRSLRGIVEEGSTHSWRAALPVECVIGRAIVTDRFKYCLYDIGTNQEHVHDRQSDQGEQENAANKPVHRHTLENLRALFREAFGSTKRNAADVVKAAAYA